jgi:hypothetical protein
MISGKVVAFVASPFPVLPSGDCIEWAVSALFVRSSSLGFFEFWSDDIVYPSDLESG